LEDFSTCGLGGAPLLERWRILEVATHTPKRWRTLLPLTFVWTLVMSVERWQPTLPHLASLSSTLGEPSLEMPCVLLLDIITHLCINKRALPLIASWSLRRKAYCTIAVILFHIGIKSALWRSRLVVCSNVWMLVNEVILFHDLCYCILV
jgi:hypothetical protein